MQINEIVIKPKKGFIGIDFLELWRYRELLYIFVWRDLKVRYKQTAIGVLWAALQPLLMMALFTFVFGRLAKVPSDGIPYPVFVFAGLLFWNYFSTTVLTASNVLVDQENLIKKVYFPRLMLPLASALTPIVDFCIAFVILLSVMAYYHYIPHLAGLLFLPVALILSFLSASGLGLLLSAVNVKYRDVRYALPFFIQILLYVTPVIYPSTLVSKNFQWVLALNPMTGIINSMRSWLFGTVAFEPTILIVSSLSALFLFLVGIFYYRNFERFFADIA